jgi:hypothetical protein
MMPRSSKQFDEVRVYGGVAERTGNTVDRNTVRGSKVVCRSMTELVRKVRREGDGIFYIASDAWPENTVRFVLTETWTTMS